MGTDRFKIYFMITIRIVESVMYVGTLRIYGKDLFEYFDNDILCT